MPDDALELVRLRNEFYRDNYRKIAMVLLLTMVIIFILGGTLIYIVTHPPKPQYFATDPQGRLIRLTPLNEPNLSTGAVLQWANVSAVAAFTYNFANYRQQLQAASEFFTPEGWQAFTQALNQSNNLDAVIAKKLVVTSVATGAPVVLQQGVIGGQYAWRVQMPMLITYESIQEVSQQNVVVTMLIVRVSVLDNPKGIGIAQFVVTPS